MLALLAIGFAVMIAAFAACIFADIGYFASACAATIVSAAAMLLTGLWKSNRNTSRQPGTSSTCER